MKYNFKELLTTSDIDVQRQFLSELNEFLYTSPGDLGTVNLLGMTFEYFSEFHKYWEKNHRKILNPKIDDEKCLQVADVFHDIYLKYGKKPFTELYDTSGLTPQEICKIRFFTANQDFRGSRPFEKFAKIYLNDPSIFDTKYIHKEPVKFLSNLGLSGLSQTDKRAKYAEKAAQILLNNELEPFDLFEFHNKDYAAIRKKLTNTQGSGYGKKKTDMFLRDMRQLEVWPKGKNYDIIDVASDINTIKVALRTGILKTDIVLLSSFLDIFCYQYELMDEMNAKAWRRVWELWTEKYPTETVEGPSLLDYLVYRLIGKEFCKDRLYLFECSVKKHTFYWHSSRNRTCQICYSKEKKKYHANLIHKDLPCKYEEGKKVIKNNKIKEKILPDIEECPFIDVCKPKSEKFIKLNPPKSISILGRTGWQTARTNSGEGGGGLMA
ncbi:MAG: hypothetical protein ACTSP3_10925 [Candidatus Heimdallarchaeaceae archaeon]